MTSPSQSGYAPHVPCLIDGQARHIDDVVAETRARGAATVERTAEGEAAWCAGIAKHDESFDPTFAEQCTPSHYDSEGMPDAGSLDRSSCVGGPTAFAELLAGWRAEGNLQALVLGWAARPNAHVMQPRADARASATGGPH